MVSSRNVPSLSLTLTPSGMLFSAAITTVVVVSLLYRVPLATVGLAGSGLAMKPLGRVKVNLPPSIETFCAESPEVAFFAACAFKIARLAAATSNRTTAFLLNTDIQILQGWSRYGGDHPMAVV